MTVTREGLRVEQGGMRHSYFLADRLETRVRDGRDSYLWDMKGWYGGDINKLWLKSEGEGGFGRSPEDAEFQALYSRAITPWFNLQTGLRYDVRPSPERTHLRSESSFSRVSNSISLPERFPNLESDQA